MRKNGSTSGSTEGSIARCLFLAVEPACNSDGITWNCDGTHGILIGIPMSIGNVGYLYV